MASGLTGCAIGAGSVDLIGTYRTHAGGGFSIDLNGSSAGTISQSFATVTGQFYNVSFSMAGNPDGGGLTKTISAGVAGVNTFSFDGTGASKTAMSWETRSFSFVAASALSTLT
nr:MULTISPECIES: DUF642 domain-containing protein [unclassified Duganella]